VVVLPLHVVEADVVAGGGYRRVREADRLDEGGPPSVLDTRSISSKARPIASSARADERSWTVTSVLMAGCVSSKRR
jgi:hypothetical protein